MRVDYEPEWDEKNLRRMTMRGKTHYLVFPSPEDRDAGRSLLGEIRKERGAWVARPALAHGGGVRKRPLEHDSISREHAFDRLVAHARRSPAGRNALRRSLRAGT